MIRWTKVTLLAAALAGAAGCGDDKGAEPSLKWPSKQPASSPPKISV